MILVFYSIEFWAVRRQKSIRLWRKKTLRGEHAVIYEDHTRWQNEHRAIQEMNVSEALSLSRLQNILACPTNMPGPSCICRWIIQNIWSSSNYFLWKLKGNGGNQRLLIEINNHAILNQITPSVLFKAQFISYQHIDSVSEAEILSRRTATSMGQALREHLAFHYWYTANFVSIVSELLHWHYWNYSYLHQVLLCHLKWNIFHLHWCMWMRYRQVKWTLPFTQGHILDCCIETSAGELGQQLHFLFANHIGHRDH